MDVYQNWTIEKTAELGRQRKPGGGFLRYIRWELLVEVGHCSAVLADGPLLQGFPDAEQLA